MNFNTLSEEDKEILYSKFEKFCEVFGSTNQFLQVVEDIKKDKPHPLLNKTAIYHQARAKLSWGKTIYDQTLDLIVKAMKNEDKTGDIFTDLSPKDYKKYMNVIRAIKPIEMTIVDKKAEDANELVFSILDTSEQKHTKFTEEFKILFFYDIPTLKNIISYKK